MCATPPRKTPRTDRSNPTRLRRTGSANPRPAFRRRKRSRAARIAWFSGVVLLGAAVSALWGGISPSGLFSGRETPGSYQAGPGNGPVRLLHADGTPIRREEVPLAYGRPGGLRVMAGEVDVASPEYADRRGIRPLEPAGWDLSDRKGWPRTQIPPGVLAIDPERGRVRFSAGQPAAPETAGHLHTGFGVPGAGVPLVKGNHVVLPGGEGDLTVMDVSIPSRPRLVSFIPTDFFYDRIHRFRDSLFLDAKRGGGRTGLALVEDFADPARPGKASMVAWRDEWGLGFRGINEKEALAYASWNGWVFVMDISNPAAVREIRRVRFDGLLSFDLSPDKRFAVAILDHGTTIGLIGLEDPRNPTLAGTLPNIAVPEPKIRFRWGKPGKFADVAEVWDGGFALRVGFWDMAVFEVRRNASNPDALSARERGRIAFGEGETVIRDVLHHRGRLFVADGRRTPGQRSLYRGFKPSRLFVVDPESPGGPSVIGEYVSPGLTEYASLGIRGDTLLVNDYNFGLWTFDVSRPDRPVLLGGHPSAAEGRFAHVSGNRAYIAHTFGGTVVAADVTRPDRPKTLGYYWDGVWMNYMGRMESRSGYLYLPKQFELTIVDFRDAARPVRAGEFTDDHGEPVQNSFIVVSGRRAFVTYVNRRTGGSHLRAYDLTDPGKPVPLSGVTLMEKQGTPWRMALSGNRLYLVPARGGRLWIYDVRDPTAMKPLGRFDQPSVYHEGRVESFQSDRGYRNGGVAAAKGYVYVTLGGRSPKEPAIFIFDVREPARPVFARLIRFPEEGWQYFYCDVAVYGGYLFGAEYKRIHVFSLADPGDPRLVHTLSDYGIASLFGRRSVDYQWTLGGFDRGYLFVPKLDGLDIIRVPTIPEYPEEGVTIHARRGG